MVQKSWQEFLQEDLIEALATNRHIDRDIFIAIKTILIDWFNNEGVSKTRIQKIFSLGSEKLLNLASWQENVVPRSQNKTWAKTAIGLLKHHHLLATDFNDLIAALEKADKINVSDCIDLLASVSAQIANENTADTSNVIAKLKALTYSSKLPRQMVDNSLSNQRFSEGLRESLSRYNDELQFLTIDQMRSLEEFFSERRLWIQGAAGTGKTIFAVEAAYRSLRAGLKVLIVYRSTQFQKVFENLLNDVSHNLHLLLHLDFMQLVRLVELHGQESDAVINEVNRLFQANSDEAPCPLFDLVILDDCGTYESELPWRIETIEKLSHKVVFLAAPDQIMSHIVFDYDDEIPESGLAEFDLSDAAGVLEQPLTPPENYSVKTLTTNVRNAQSISSYIKRFSPRVGNTGIKERGKQQSVKCSWNNVDEILIKITSELLQHYTPNNIKILVDPHLYHQEFSGAGKQGARDKQQYLNTLPVLTKALLETSQFGNFLHTTMEATDELLRVLAEDTQSLPYFMYSDGEIIGKITESDLSESPVSNDLMQTFQHCYSPYVDATKVLEQDALSDPFKSTEAIFIYQSPLFIGLEADAIIYVRNHSDLFHANPHISDTVKERLNHARNEHHYMSMSRAKHTLIDLSIE